ncbi:MAG: DUF433 domain-containing protein [Acidobacteriota bacterium]|nr:DUF433 domain-containing protein [Acidobacteriota bacterium]
MSTATSYEHIVLDKAGIPVIKGTNTKIVEIVLEMKAYGWSPEEIHFQHPHLTLGQIHSALAYYWDNADEINLNIKERLGRIEEIRRLHGDKSEIREKLREKGLI